jgi:hypothetical protein
MEVIGTDFRDILSESERNVVMMNLQSLTEEKPERRLQVSTKNHGAIRLQDWTDHASFENGVIIEYQRVGRDVTDMFKPT